MKFEEKEFAFVECEVVEQKIVDCKFVECEVVEQKFVECEFTDCEKAEEKQCDAGARYYWCGDTTVRL